MTRIQAIETEYAGCRFRSRLEARWAVFFQTLGVEWHYEAEGYELPSGRYLPDFWLPSVLVNAGTHPVDGRRRRHRGMHFEVKGQTPTVDEFWKLVELEQTTGFAAAIGWGSIPDSTRIDDHGRNSEGPARVVRPFQFQGETGTKDGMRLGVMLDSYPGWGAQMCCGQVFFGVPTGILCGCSPLGWGHPSIKDAYRAARSARFEFGESG